MSANEDIGHVDFVLTEFQAVLDADVDGLLDAPEKPQKITSSRRLERAFLEIVEFYRTHGRVPSSSTRAIAERKLGARLDGFLASDERVSAVKHLDEFGLLDAPEAPTSIDELLEGGDLDELLGDDSGILDVSDLPRARRADPNEVAQRTKATGFEEFEPMFVLQHEQLRSGVSKLVSFAAAGGQKVIAEGRFFVLSGVMLYVAEVTEPQPAPGVRTRMKRRTRTIFENGTESSLFRRSLAGQLLEHDGQAVVPASFGEVLAEDEESGYIYVLRSLSEDPTISAIKDLYKIGFSRGPVEKRIAKADKQPTYLMAPVEVLASYKTFNLKASTLEHLLHRVFAEVRLDISQVDRKGRDYDPSEWFIVPRHVVDQAINMIVSGEITSYVYDRDSQRLVERD